MKLAFFTLILLLSACASVQVQEDAAGIAEDVRQAKNIMRVHQGPIRVMSLNLAHGRKDALNQLLVSTNTIGNNLKEIAQLLNREHVDVVALQEADGPSRWSGGFDHVALLANQASYPWYERASHAQNWLFDYGTALMSRTPFTLTQNHTFDPSPPTMNKGFLLGQIAWQEGQKEKRLVDIISVHLDFSRRKVRELQIKEMAELLGKREHPIIILGDFNSDWFSDASIVRALADRAGLQVYRPDAIDLGTYKNGRYRYDWILISDELEFREYKVLPDVISDHRAVVAEIAFRP